MAHAIILQKARTMAKKIIDIDGYIGPGGYSSQYVKNALRDAKNDDVEVHINSLGGDVSHAIAIKDALQAHGNVIAVYSGMSASSATIISLGCKSIRMTKDSFYLVHKPMMYVDAWGALNEDELKDLIEKLDSQLENAQKVTLQLAKMYTEKTGASIKSVLDLMKKSVWLTAEEALKWNFVDTLTDPVKVTNYAEDMKLVALLAGNDLPPLPRKNIQSSTGNDDLPGKIKKEGDSIIENLKKLFSNHTKNKNDMSKPMVFTLLCAAMAINAIEMTDDGVFLNKEQLNSLEAELKKLHDAKALAETNLATAKTERETAVNSLSAVNTAMDDLDATVKAVADPAAKVEAIRKKLAEKPGVVATAAARQSDPTYAKIEGADQVTDYVKKVI
jgi:ATP-dependent protease ClpP protease subunit